MTNRVTHSVYLLLACGALACGSSSDGKSATSDTGGATTEGAGNSAGGDAASSAGAPQGGAASTADPQGGAPQGGTASGGAAQGGAASGGSSDGEGGTTTDDTTPSLGCGNPTTLTSGTATIEVNGVAREYILKLPDDYQPSQPYRLVFGWHQLAGSAAMIARMGYYGLEEPSAGQAIFVAPQGLYQITPSSGNLDAGWWNNDGEDVDFYHAMLERFTSELCIDESRIFSVGFSFGAMFSFTVACDASNMIRAIAPMAGGGGRCDQRVAVMGFVGQQDGLLSGHVGAIERFAASNGCSGEPVAQQPSWCDTRPDDAACLCLEYQNCDEGYPAVSCEYTNGHMFAPNSGQTIWDFFAQF